MRALVDLDPMLVRYEKRDGTVYNVHVDSLADAQGFPDPKSGRRAVSGSGIEDLTLTGCGRVIRRLFDERK